MSENVLISSLPLLHYHHHHHHHPPSSTMSTTATETQNNAPEITILTRFGSIPLVSGSLDSINKALTTNSYTCTPYNTAKELSMTAYKYTEPIQVRLAPLIVRADGLANKAVDAVEARYPYPFKAKPEEVATYVHERRQSVTDYYNGTVDGVAKVVDERVRSPAVQAAQGLDQVSSLRQLDSTAPLTRFVSSASPRSLITLKTDLETLRRLVHRTPTPSISTSEPSLFPRQSRTTSTPTLRSR